MLGEEWIDGSSWLGWVLKVCLDLDNTDFWQSEI
jgi:hypothetical protein